MAIKNRPTDEMKAMLRSCASFDEKVAAAALAELAQALTLPLQQGVLKGDITFDIFEETKFEPGTSVEYPLDFLSPGTEKDFIAFTIPNHGSLPTRHVEGDYVMVPTYDVGNVISANLKYARDARWDVVGRMMQVLEAGFIRKNNADAWHTLLASAKNRNLVIYDDAATAGLFTKRLISLMKTSMRRNAGGNSTSTNKGKLTDLYMSPEALEDIRSWDLSQIDDVTRREIFLNSGDDGVPVISTVFGVRIHDIDEFGVNQEFQNYFTDTLGGSLGSDKVELVIGLDLLNRDSFVRPVRQEMEVFEDLSLHKTRRFGLYSWAEGGWGVLSSRRVLAGSL
jgi:hypothetical protein